MNWEKVTIFIESTFSDMHGERDYLVKNVFPELREWCEERKLHLVDVDLRWGVTAENAENNNTIKTVLNNIDQCRPFYLCLLGQKRGWVPNIEDISLETKMTYPEIENFINGKSITEFSIEHAVLNPLTKFRNGQEIPLLPAKYALFYFREDDYIDYLNDSQKCIYTNQCESNPEKSDFKFNKFKDRIKNSELDFTYYQGVWDENHIVPELDHMGEKVALGGFTKFIMEDGSHFKDTILNQLKEKISMAFPKNMEIEKVTSLQKELDQQDHFREINIQGFIPNKKLLNELDSYLENDDNKLCILTSEAGFGKTSLLASFTTNLMERNDLRIFTRFAGISNKSENQYDIWRTIIEESAVHLPKGKDSLDDWLPNFEELQKNIGEVFENLSKNKKTIIILDGINQLHNGLTMFKWLPKELPKNLKIILSLKEDEESQELISIFQEHITHFRIRNLESDEEKRVIINKYLEQFLKVLDEEQIDMICKTKGSDNPLLLKILLNELKVFGQVDKLNEQISNFPSNPTDAFQKVLDRLENEKTYTKIDSKKIVKLIFGLIANARYGLSESELVECIKIWQKENNDIIFEVKDLIQTIQSYIRQLRPFMKISEGKFDFLYGSFKIASIKKYQEDNLRFNQTLSDYFLQQADPDANLSFKGENIRHFNELPYHLVQANNFLLLEKILSTYLWIKGKISLSSIYDTIRDYEHLEKRKENHHINLIKKTLVLSSHIVMKDNNSLATQLWGRLKNIENHKIKELLIEIEKYTNYPWFKPHHNMSSPNGPLKTVLTDHTDTIHDVEFSPDGKYVVSTSEDGSIRVWDWNTKEELSKFESEHGFIHSKFSPEGKYIVSGSIDGGVHVFDWERQSEIIVLKGHTLKVNCVCFSPEGKYIVSGCESGRVSVWDWNNNQEIVRLIGHTNSVSSVDFSPDGNFIVSGSVHCNTRIWDWKNKKEVIKFKGKGNSVNSVGFSPGGRYIFSNSSDTTISIWDWEKNIKMRDFNHEDRVNSVKFSPNGKYIVSGLKDSFICIWDWRNKKEINRLIGHKLGVNAVNFSPDSKYIVSGSVDESIRVWEWEKKENEEINHIRHFTNVNCVDFSPDERYFVSGSRDKTIRVFDWKRKKELVKLIGHSKGIYSVEFSPDGKYIVSGSWDGSIRIWDWKNLEELVFLETSDWVNSVTFSPDGNLVVSGTKDNIIRIWDWKNQKELAKYEGHSGSVEIVCFSHDGEYVFSSSLDGSIRIWDWQNQKIFVKREEQANNINFAGFSPNSNYFAIGYEDGRVHIWDWNSNEEISKLEGHKSPINNISFFSDEMYLVTSSNDGTIGFWDWKNRKLLYSIDSEELILFSSISKNNDKIVAGTESGLILMYSIENSPDSAEIFYPSTDMVNSLSYLDFSQIDLHKDEELVFMDEEIDDDLDYDVFISWNNADEDIADYIYECLRNNDIKPWISSKNIPGGVAFRRQIMKAIRKSKVGVYIYSKNSQDSPYCILEIDHLFSNKKSIIPYKIGKFKVSEDIEFYLPSMQCIQSYPNPKEKIHKLIHDVFKLLNNFDDNSKMTIGTTPSKTKTTCKLSENEEQSENKKISDFNNLNETVEDLAQAIHEHSNKTKHDNGLVIDFPFFDDLSEKSQNYYIFEAKWILRMLKKIDCKLTSRLDSKEEILFDKDTVEYLAKLNHGKWVNDTKNLELFFNKSNLQIKKDIHVVPWYALDDNIKEYDKEYIRSISKLVAIIHKKIVKIE
ncbi:MAG: TIR domain-containing protein [Methanobrevibacter sp.]|nr:TIR domain-containing protein [Methanobrevibacter sp.]